MTLEEQATFLRSLSENDFRALGAQNFVYVREVEFLGQTHYSVHAADGRALTLAKSRDLAHSAIQNTDWEPVILH